MSFADEDVVVQAAPRSPLLRVAAAAGVHIPTRCGSGSCGTCEVELRVVFAAGRAPPGEVPVDEYVTRACVTRLPSAPATVTVTHLRDDAIWGAQ